MHQEVSIFFLFFRTCARLGARSHQLFSYQRTFRTSASVYAVPPALESFGFYCFTKDAMRDYLDRSTFAEMDAFMDNKQPLSEETMEKFAKAVHKWAVDRG